MCILGDMKELGEASAEEHQKTIDTVCQHGFEAVWLVGEEFAKTKHPATFRTFADVNEVKEAIKVSKPEGFTILIKGSNSTKLVQLAELL